MDFLEGIFVFIAIGVCSVIWLIPIVMIAVSDRTDGREKFAWILAVIFISWFAWIFYLLLAPLREPRHCRYREYRRY
ncbi:PLDc N-terminal domain-containing protein [Aliikangiella sp. G2MR2-5]|uniref:PLDc N-terminal domain-containing protein n=1 Tax=Aliikangiella sp. G2MR2-5 TaxID=2788943 RepID=UPI0018AA769B|nr:hypothetical protein [Aliikangiella sp. G2MR2-5]